MTVGNGNLRKESRRHIRTQSTIKRERGARRPTESSSERGNQWGVTCPVISPKWTDYAAQQRIFKHFDRMTAWDGIPTIRSTTLSIAPSRFAATAQSVALRKSISRCIKWNGSSCKCKQGARLGYNEACCALRGNVQNYRHLDKGMTP
jgi:hypothetical protein